MTRFAEGRLPDGAAELGYEQTLEALLDVHAIDGWAYEVAVAPDNAAAVVAGSDGQIHSVDFGAK